MRNGSYTLVIAPENYPGKRYRSRYCYEHHLIYWKHTGEIVDKDEVIHHKNHNKTDNRFVNLEKKNRLSHIREHAAEKRIPLIKITCAWCGQKSQTMARNYRWKIKNGQKNFYCSKSCGTKHYWQKMRWSLVQIQLSEPYYKYTN